MIRGCRRLNEKDERLVKKRRNREDQRCIVSLFDPLFLHYLPSKAGPSKAAKNTKNFSDLSMSSLCFGLFSIRADEFPSRRMTTQIVFASFEAAIRSEVRVSSLISHIKELRD